MYSTILKGEIENRRYGVIISFVIHTILLIGFIFAKLSTPIPPPPEQGGILVNLGVPDQEGTGNENAPEGKPAPVEEAKPEPEPVKETTKPSKPEPTKPKPETSKPQPQKEVVTSEDPEAIALKRKKEQEKKQKDAEARQQADDARKQKDAADAKARKDAEDARKQKELQDQIGGALGGGKGKGKGNSGKTGNPGDPNGGDSDILSGKTTGNGFVEGFGNRKFTSPGKPSDNSQETGVVAVRVCIDKTGKVSSAEFTQKGSTTTSSNLIRIAVDNAKRFKFDAGSVDTQCGTITYTFKVK